MKSIVFYLVLIACLAESPAQAQLLREEVSDEQRTCFYLGSQQDPNGSIVERTLVVGAAQPCPTTAPYRDPDRPPPANAGLRGEATTTSNRICTYEQGGISYALSVPLTVRCAMTPGLLEHSLDQR